MYKYLVKTYNLLNCIWQTHATVDLCVSVFSTDMHSSSLGARPGGFLCRHQLSSQCALHKHHNRVFGRKFGKRGWICVPLVVEAYGGWGITAKETLSRIACLAIHSQSSNSETLNAMYCRLGTVLMRQNARAPWLDRHHFRDFLWCGLVNVYLFVYSCILAKSIWKNQFCF